MKPPTEGSRHQQHQDNRHHHHHASGHGSIKPSQSLTSLPPSTTGGSGDGIEFLVPKLRIDRPYNSLKKKRNSERDIWRRSWESGHSHSSCSLQSSTTTNNGSGTGKDDFWAALQTNYNYIMDTNLLDSCREARGELEGNVVPEIKISDADDSCGKLFCPATKSQGSHAGNPRTLRRWLREMENRIAQSPTLSEALKMKSGEIQNRLSEHSEIYREIVSQARTVGSCIRASEAAAARNNKSTAATAQGESSAEGGGSASGCGDKEDPQKKSGGSDVPPLKGLERRYHLLYLKAIEIQCLLEGLLSRKNSPSPVSRTSDTDEEPAAKLARLSDSEYDNHLYSDGGSAAAYNYNSEECADEDDDDWQHRRSSHKLVPESAAQAAGFDADSEGSDYEIIPIVVSSGGPSCSSVGTSSCSPLPPLSPPICHDQNMMETNEPDNNNDVNNESSLANTSATSSTPSFGYGAEIINTIIKRPKPIDISKFNRSNRKSKNCAIFYFKHLDTDTEQRAPGQSSQGSESAFRSDNPSSDDEWYFQTVKQQHKMNGTSTTTSGSSTTNGNAHKPLNFFNDDFDDDCVDADCRNANLINTMMNGGGGGFKMGKSRAEGGGDMNGNNNSDEIIGAESIDVVDCEIKAQIIESRGNIITELVEEEEVSMVKVDDGNTNGAILEEKGMLQNGNCANAAAERKDYKNELHYRKESIHQLVLGAENLVREEVLLKINSPTQKSSSSASSRKSYPEIFAAIKCDKMSNPKIKRVQEWLERQPLDENNTTSAPTTDCDASGEYTTESDGRESDTSEGMADSIATCLQGGGSNSQATSTEVIGGSHEPLVVDNLLSPEIDCVSAMEKVKVIMRINRRNSDRPWSVSCLSQLTQAKNVSRSDDKVNTQGVLAIRDFSISESALHIMTSQNCGGRSEDGAQQISVLPNSDSKNSLKKRRAKLRKRATAGSGNLRKSESGSDSVLPYPEMTRSLTNNKSLTKSESFSGQSNSTQELCTELSMMTLPTLMTRSVSSVPGRPATDSEEEQHLMKPNFCLGAYTNVLIPGGVSNLGSLAALATYNHEAKPEQESGHTGTEEHSSFSEQAWDPYQEKYNSENYSEGFDSDAARRLLEFGDDYRNFLDSQSDCCSSSLSAANNLDSLSPPRHRKFMPTPQHSRSPSDTANSSLENSLRRRRAHEVAEMERKRRNSNASRKMSSDERRRSGELNASNNHISNGRVHSRNSDSSEQSNQPLNRKLDFDQISTPATLKPPRRKASESDASYSRKQHDTDATSRRRSVRSIEKLALKNMVSSSSSSDSEDDIEVQNLLTQSKSRLENTEALKVRSHLLRPEDYAEIIATCRDNIRCLEAVLRGVPGTVLTPQRHQETRDLLSSWESLLNWSENASVARQLQEEMTLLKLSLHRLGIEDDFINGFDTEESILYAIEELKKEKVHLNNHRSTMLRLNASVHSWLTRQEMKTAQILETTTTTTTTLKSAAGHSGGLEGDVVSSSNDDVQIVTVVTSSSQEEKGEQFDNQNAVDVELHKYLKEEVGDMYSAWDDADLRIKTRLENLTTSLNAWKLFESSLTDFKETLGKDKGTLCGLKGALDRGKRVPFDLAHDVREVAKLLSEKIDTNMQYQNMHPNGNGIGLGFPFIGIKSSSNGSLSDSGISDGGCISDGGLSEREKRLGALRRLARQLENALAPGSEALKSITRRMEAAEVELRTLQTTCRELIVRTANSQSHSGDFSPPPSPLIGGGGGGGSSVVSSSSSSLAGEGGGVTVEVPSGKGKMKRSPQRSRRNSNSSSKTASPQKRKSSSSSSGAATAFKSSTPIQQYLAQPGDEPDPDDPASITEYFNSDDDDCGERKNWIWRVARLAFPVQLAILTIFCAACLLEPNCCDQMNTFSNSFSPQLRYIRGPPPI